MSDYNLADENIDFCLVAERVDDWVVLKLNDGYPLGDVNTVKDLTIDFLKWLKTIPSDIREYIGY